MTAKSIASRWIPLFALMAVAAASHAESSNSAGNASLRLPDAKLVWVDNESFAFNTCSAAGGEHVASMMSALRKRLIDDLGPMLLSNGVTPASQQFVTLTPVSGAQNCSSLASQMVFRLAGVSAKSVPYWTADVVAQSAGPVSDQASAAQATVQVVNDLLHEVDVALGQASR